MEETFDTMVDIQNAQQKVTKLIVKAMKERDSNIKRLELAIKNACKIIEDNLKSNFDGIDLEEQMLHAHIEVWGIEGCKDAF